MSRIIVPFNVFISCPSDIKKQLVSDIKECIRSCNDEKFIVKNGYFCIPKYWGDNISSGIARKNEDAQQQINRELLYSSHALIAVFQTKFGSPTEFYKSGAQEEIERAIKMGIPVHVYFSEQNVEILKKDANEYLKVEEFKNNLGKYGVYYVTQDEKQLIEKIRSNLRHKIEQLFRDRWVPEIFSDNRSQHRYMDAVRTLRTEKLVDTFDKIDSRFWRIGVRSEADYATSLFTDMLRILDDGDVYCTLSNIEFWEAINSYEFLNENIDAIERGIKLNRIFLIDNKDIAIKTLKRHLSFLNDLSEDQKKQVSIKVLEVDDVKPLIFDKTYGHYGLAHGMTSDSKTDYEYTYVAKPVYHNGKITQMDISFRSKNNKPIIRSFYDHMKDAVNLSEFLNEG